MDKINSLIEKIKEKRELSGISDDIVKESLERFVRNNRININYLTPRYEKIIIKEIRAELRKYSGRFNSKILHTSKVKKKDFINMLNMHSSTKERLDFYPTLNRIIESLKVKSILDLGCGLNPIAVATKDRTYYAADINEEYLSIIGEFFSINKIKGKVFLYDLRKINKDLLEADLCLILKLFDVLERRGHKLAEKIVKEVRCNYMIVSFSTKTLSGKPMNHPQRGWIERMLSRLGFKFETFKSKNEIFYLIYKSKQGT